MYRVLQLQMCPLRNAAAATAFAARCGWGTRVSALMAIKAILTSPMDAKVYNNIISACTYRP